jgi:hypothetical protein
LKVDPHCLLLLVDEGKAIGKWRFRFDLSGKLRSLELEVISHLQEQNYLEFLTSSL